MTYKRIDQIGCVVTESPIPHIKYAALDEAIERAGLDREKFSEYFGVQTCYQGGLYPWDVEDVLERMMSGKLTGTQLIMD